MIKAIATLRSLLGLVFFVIHTFLLGSLMLFAGATQILSLQDWILQTWGAGILWMFGISVEIEGLENVPKNTGVILLFNHQSFVDIFVIAAFLKHRMRYGAKIELFKIPVFGRAMKAANVLPIVRKDRHAVFKIYNEAKNRFKEGWSYALAPEGTRQVEDQIGPFKKGPFIFAINSGATVLPIVIRGARQAWGKGSLLPNTSKLRTKVKARILTPTATTDYSLETIDSLMTKVRGQMQVAYEQLG